jgi:hypothetical protein
MHGPIRTRGVEVPSVLLATIHPILIIWVAVGAAMLVWNRRFSEAMIASQKAFADTLGVKSLQRWTNFSMRPRIVRGYTIVFAVIWLALSLIGFLGLFSGKPHPHHPPFR